MLVFEVEMAVKKIFKLSLIAVLLCAAVLLASCGDGGINGAYAFDEVKIQTDTADTAQINAYFTDRLTQEFSTLLLTFEKKTVVFKAEGSEDVSFTYIVKSGVVRLTDGSGKRAEESYFGEGAALKIEEGRIFVEFDESDEDGMLIIRIFFKKK